MWAWSHSSVEDSPLPCATPATVGLRFRSAVRMNIFIAVGLLCLLLAYLHQSPARVLAHDVQHPCGDLPGLPLVRDASNENRPGRARSMCLVWDCLCLDSGDCGRATRDVRGRNAPMTRWWRNALAITSARDLPAPEGQLRGGRHRPTRRPFVQSRTMPLFLVHDVSIVRRARQASLRRNGCDVREMWHTVSPGSKANQWSAANELHSGGFWRGGGTWIQEN